MALTVKEFIQEIRDNIGDDTNSLTVASLLSFINESLRELTSELIHFTPFIVDDTIELSDYTETGKAAQEWRLDDDRVGDIAHIRTLRLVNTESCEECDVLPAYVNNKLFTRGLVRNCGKCEPKCCLKEIRSTYVKNLKGTFLRVSSPLPSGTVAHIQYEFVPRIYRKTDLNEVMPINLIMMNLLLTLVKAKIHSYNADDSRAQALYESYDKMVYEIKQQLARDNSDFVWRRSF